MISTTNIEKEIEFYKILHDKQSHILRFMPANNIFFKYQHGKWRPYTIKLGKEHYLNKAEHNGQIARLMEKKFIEQSLKCIKENIKALQELRGCFIDFDKLLPPAFGHSLELAMGKGFSVEEHLPAFQFSKSKTVQEREWLSLHAPLNPYKTEKKVHTTSSGIKVRSKSELVIASFLEMRDIPYKYEELLIIGGNKWYPDFKVRRPRDGKIIIWEHFGMMDDANYAAANQERLIVYMEYGFRLLDNLVITYDEDGGLDMTILEKIYELVLK